MSAHGLKLNKLVRIEIEASDLTNLCTNPIAATNTTGWSSDTGAAVAQSSSTVSPYWRRTGPGGGMQYLSSGTGYPVVGTAIKATYDGSGALHAEVHSPSFAVVPGRWIGYQFHSADLTYYSDPRSRVRHRVRFFDASSNLISNSDPETNVYFTSDDTTKAWWDWEVFDGVVQVPAGAVSARVSFAWFDQVGGVDSKPARSFLVTDLMVVMSETAASVATVPYSASTIWQNIAGSSKSVRFNRGGDVDGVVDDIEPGQLVVVIADASFDPAQNVRARYGRKIRVSGSSDGLRFYPLFTGRIASVEVDYTSTKGQKKTQYRPLVTLTGTDAVAELSAVPSPITYADALFERVARKHMSLTSVPYAAGASASTIIGAIENASVWDQLQLARNGFPGARVYVNRSGECFFRSDEIYTANWAYAARPQVAQFKNQADNPSFVQAGAAPSNGTAVNLTMARSSDWAADGATSLKLTSSSASGAKTWAPHLTPFSSYWYAPIDALASTVTLKAIMTCRARLTITSADGTSSTSSFVDMTAGSVYRLKVGPFSVAAGKTASDYSAVVTFTASVSDAVLAATGDVAYVDRTAFVTMAAAHVAQWGDYYFDGDGAVEFVGGSATATKPVDLATRWLGIPYADGSVATRGLILPLYEAGVNLGTTTPATYSYVDYQATLGSKSIVNSLLIKRTNNNEPDGEKTYGPYLNQASVVDWGPSSAELQIVDGNPATLAPVYLARYANPGVVLSGLTIDCANGNPLSYATFCELYDRMTFENDVSGIYGTYVIIGIEQEITPDSWIMKLRTRPIDQTAGVTVANGSGALDAGPADLLGPSGRSTELASGVDLNNVTAPGSFAQSQSTDAAAGTNYPVPQAGLLEVAANADLTMIWQRYTVYNGGSFANDCFTRTFYSGAWSPWRIIGRDLYAGEAACSTALTCPVAATDVAGATLSVSVADPSEVFQVVVTFEVQTLTTGAGTFTGRLVVNGVSQGAQVVWVAPATAGLRNTLTRKYRITGLAAGTRVFKLQAAGSVASVYRVNVTHSTINVDQSS